LSKLKQAFKAGEFVITAEVGPPKGSDVSEMLHHAKALKGKVHAVNVTDNQSSVMRLGSLAGCHLLLDHGLEPVFQLTCRDRNRLALQSDLLSAHVLGMRNVLALTGDHVLVGDHPQAKPVFDLESVQLLQVIGRLNSGRDMATHNMGAKSGNKELPEGNELQGNTEFFAGAVVTPEADPLEPQLMKFEKKVQAGAQFFQTQAIYDLDKFAKFMDYAKPFGVKILAGILLLRSAAMARYLNNFVPGITVPDSLIQELEAAKDKAGEDKKLRSQYQLEAGIKIAARQVQELHKSKTCAGVHIMAIGLEDKVPAILAEAGVDAN
jgi:5,10-methylenetetrahydrofolate reductase